LVPFCEEKKRECRINKKKKLKIQKPLTTVIFPSIASKDKENIEKIRFSGFFFWFNIYF